MMLIGQENLRSSPSPPVSCAETLAQNNESQENHGGLKKNTAQLNILIYLRRVTLGLEAQKGFLLNV